MHKSTLLYKVSIVLIALLLFVPGILGLQSDPERRSEIERRELAAAPQISLLWREPKTYFGNLSLYLSDRTGGVIEAKSVLAKSQFYLFRDSPSENLHLGKGGEVFVHTFNPERPYAAASLCYPVAQEGRYSAISTSQFNIQSELQRQGIELQTLIVPSKITLYGDQFGYGAPLAVRNACRLVAQNGPGETALNELKDVFIVYPFDEFFALRDDPNFYPKGNFHWSGASIHEAVKAWLDRLPEKSEVALDDTYSNETLPNDIEQLVGFGRTYEGRVYDYFEHGIVFSRDLPVPSPEIPIAHWRWSFSTSENPVFQKRVLLLSNSFGIEGHLHFASLYKELFWININDITMDGRAYLIQEYTQVYKPDIVILMFHDVAASREISLISEALE